jgi:heterotetrameric sarcosine oxidase gamma subunit
MKVAELLVTRLPALRVSLLQIHGATTQAAELFADHILGDHGKHRSPTAGPRVFSIGPMEWLLIEHSINDVRRRLQDGEPRAFVRLTDVSHAFTSFSIRGAYARAVLAGDIGAPPAVSAAGPGHYAKIRLGQIEVILHCTGENAFDVHVDCSLADHFESWLEAQRSARFPGCALTH